MSTPVPGQTRRGIAANTYEAARAGQQAAINLLDQEGYLDEFGEIYDLYRCTDCDRYFSPGDTFVNGDGREWCYADTGNGCIERYYNTPGSDATR